MKQLLTMALVAVLVSGCRKDVCFSNQELANNIRKVVTDSMESGAVTHFDFSRIVQVKVSSDSVYYLLWSKATPYEFMVFLMDGQDKLQRGVQIRLGQIAGRKPWDVFNGTIVIKSLTGKHLLSAPVENGYIHAFQNPLTKPLFSIERRGKAAPIDEDPYETLSEVIVIGYPSPSGGYAYSTWMSVNSMFGNGSGGWYYVPVSGYQTPRQDGVIPVSPIKIDVETDVSNPAIDVNRYLDCFSRLPDATAKCSIEILTDIPVDTDPNKLVDWRAGSAGHTFLQFRKQVGNNIIIQNIGFYPVQGWKVMFTNAPVPGKFVDNSRHEFNASLRIDVNTEQFGKALNELRYLARNSAYDLDEFNCTDLAIRVFSSACNLNLDIPMYDIPGGITAGGTSTPQGLFVYLRQLHNSSSPLSKNITLPGVKGYVAASNGPCN